MSDIRNPQEEMILEDELPDLPYQPMVREEEPSGEKRKTSHGEEEFLRLQADLEAILAVPKQARTPEQQKFYTNKGPLFSKMKTKFPHLLKAKKKPVPGAQRESERRKKMSEERREEETATLRNPTHHTSPSPSTATSMWKSQPPPRTTSICSSMSPRGLIEPWSIQRWLGRMEDSRGPPGMR